DVLAGALPARPGGLPAVRDIECGTRGAAVAAQPQYWQAGSWLGLGCGAHSTWNGIRWRNIPGAGEYVDRLAEGARVRTDERALSPVERLEEVLFMGLRLTEGLDLDAIRATHGVDVWGDHGGELERCVEGGLLVHEGGRLALTRPGMLVASEIMMVFIGDAVR
ncbi:MAG TPA: hypothetical protein PKW63_17045, partial [Vicinamibacterales bacterium]|nr:hypothetical protein [Vicinamibacterales bacterium]